MGSSAGNTRGLIEARPAAYRPASRTGLPRGIPAASLKPEDCARRNGHVRGVFRGEYPRPH